jgi:enoyl-CoA hydratase
MDAMQHEYASGKIKVDVDGAIATIVIDRPEVRNALDHEAAAGLNRALRDFDADRDLRTAVLTGRGGSFCAGADLKEMATDVEYVAWAGHADGPTSPALNKPVIAAVEGHACAGGLGVALFCDIRIADETAVFGVFSRRWGVPMSDGTTVRLPRLIGMSRALHMLLTGDAVPAARAQEWGLVSEVVAAGTARERAEELARRIASFPQIAMRSDRQSAYRQAGLELAEALAFETQLAEAAKRQEAQSGAAKFAAGAGRHGNFDDT